MYDQDAGNATLFVDGVAVTSQTSIPQGGSVVRPTTETDTIVETSVPSTEINSALPVALISSGLRIGAGGDPIGAGDGSTGLVGFIDEVFVYGTALTVDELDYIYRAAQVSIRSDNCSRRGVTQRTAR